VFVGPYSKSLLRWVAHAILIGGLSLCVPSTSDAIFAQGQTSAAGTSSVAAPQDRVAIPFAKELGQASALAQSGKLDQAEQAYRAVLVQAAAAADLHAQAQAHGGLGSIFSQSANYPAARNELEVALALFEALQDAPGQAMANTLLGGVYRISGDNQSARDRYHRALEIEGRLGRLRFKAILLGDLAMAGDPDGDKLLEQELEIARQIGARDLQASALHAIGDNLFNKGQYDAAQDRLNEAAQFYQKYGDLGGLARVLTSEGRVERAHGHPDQALRLYQQALDLQQKIGDRQGAIQTINAMAVAHDALNDYVKSAETYQRALDMAKATGSQYLVDFEQGNLAGALISLGKNEEAARILQELMSHGVAPYLKPYRYLSLSEVQLNLGKLRQALAAASEAVDTARDQTDRDILPKTLYQKAQVEARLGDQNAALADAAECLQAIEELRKHLVPSDFMKRGFAAITQDLFGFSIELLARANQPGRAIEIAEQARSRAFLDLLATRDVQIAAGKEPLASLDKAREMALPRLEPNSVPSNSTPGILTRGENQNASELWNRLAPSDAELGSPVSVRPFSLEQLHEAARRLNSTVLSYWVSAGATYAWVISPGGTVHLARVEVTSKHLTELVGALWPGRRSPGTGSRGAEPTASGEDQSPQAVIDPAGVPTRGGAILTVDGTSRKNWRELYRLLIQPVEQWLPQAPGSLITIEPSGPLLMLPFAALRNARGQYLIERFTLHYIPAVSLLAFTGKKESTRQRPYYLLVADPSGIPRGPSGRPLPALAGARREASIVAGLVPASEVKLLEGRDATERQVEDLAGRSSVLHFATHGIIRDDQPFDSFLALGGSGWNLKQDGHFTAQKIYGLDLHADLVFLSACRSGLGQVSGDGMAGLTRAFFYAGTPSVIATLWDVADEPTYRLVGAFYRSWLSGSDKARALRSAQLKLLGELRRGRVRLHTSAGSFQLPEDPVFWASFVLQGEP
jgi:CHAT domain-containing protein/tetratricopeptide (TPR) repeat protein